MITFSLLKQPTEQDRREINLLAPQVSANGGKTSKKEFREIVRDANNFFLVVRDNGHIVGMGMLVLSRTPLKLRAHIECVVVDKAYRGKGLGKELMKKLLAIAAKKKVYSIQLTSRPARKTGQKLYQHLGFEKVTTNVYRMKL